MGDHEYMAIVPELWEGDKALVFGVDKVGGGTLGLRYEGLWEVTVYDNAKNVAQFEVRTGTAKRHDEAAAIGGQFWTYDMGDEENWPVYDRVNYWADKVLDYNG